MTADLGRNTWMTGMSIGTTRMTWGTGTPEDTGLDLERLNSTVKGLDSPERFRDAEVGAT